MTKERKYFIISIFIAILLAFLIIIINPITSDVNLLPDQGGGWYYWQLSNRINYIMIIVWMLFLVHLVGNVLIILKRVKIKEPGFNKWNSILLIFNLMMIILHYIETIYLYDGLAQDVPIWTSQYSVIVILIILLVMQAGTRGIFLGKKIKLNPKASKLLYKVHGFLFTLAIVYTFWFHPVVFTIGHLTGFFYMFLLFIQISFVKTKSHYNKIWILILEVLVAIHGACVAYFVQSSDLWSMFFFGFLFIFVMTQIYSLPIKPFIRRSIQVIYFLTVIIYYSITGIQNIHQILWIPTIEYLGALALILIAKLVYKNKKKV